jgi:hypothetical protein
MELALGVGRHGSMSHRRRNLIKACLTQVLTFDPLEIPCKSFPRNLLDLSRLRTLHRCIPLLVLWPRKPNAHNSMFTDFRVVPGAANRDLGMARHRFNWRACGRGRCRRGPGRQSERFTQERGRKKGGMRRGRIGAAWQAAGWRCTLSRLSADFQFSKKEIDFWRCSGSRATVFPEASRRHRRATEAIFFAFNAFCAFLHPSRIACVGLCHDLRPGLPSRDRHLRR